MLLMYCLQQDAFEKKLVFSAATKSVFEVVAEAESTFFFEDILSVSSIIYQAELPLSIKRLIILPSSL